MTQLDFFLTEEEERKEGTRLYNAWLDFHTRNPEVYNLIEKYTLELIDEGFKRYSIKAVYEKVRWTPRNFKIKYLKNDYHAYYARYFMEQNPQHDGFYEIRKVKDD